MRTLSFLFLLPVLFACTTKSDIASQVSRPTTDFSFAGPTAGTLYVVANPANNTNNQYLVEFIDLT